MQGLWEKGHLDWRLSRTWEGEEQRAFPAENGGVLAQSGQLSAFPRTEGRAPQEWVVGGVVAPVVSCPHTFTSSRLKHSVPWLLAGNDDWLHSADPSLGIDLAAERAAWPKVMTLLDHPAPRDKSKRVCGGRTDAIKTGPLPQPFQTTPEFPGGSVRRLLWLRHSSFAAPDHCCFSRSPSVWMPRTPQQTSYMPAPSQSCLPGEPRA